MSDDELGRLFQKAAKDKGFGPLTPEEAQAAYDAAEPVPISEERIAEIVAHATQERTAMSDESTNYAAQELLAKIGLASSGEAWQPILTAMQRQHPDFRDRDKLVSAFWKGVDDAIRPLCEAMLRLRQEAATLRAENGRLKTEINDLGPAVEMYGEFCVERASLEAEIAKLRTGRDAAVAAEMERCIRVTTALCRETNLEGEDAGEEIADAIRRRE